MGLVPGTWETTVVDGGACWEVHEARVRQCSELADGIWTSCRTKSNLESYFCRETVLEVCDFLDKESNARRRRASRKHSRLVGPKDVDLSI